jgi:CheY-like chemotaxis protein
MEPQSLDIDVLLAEDNEDDVLLVRESLEETSIAKRLHVARDGLEALDYVRRRDTRSVDGRPLLVLLDINMPRMNGFEGLGEMKAAPALKHIPVVMLTTSSREEDMLKSYRIGAASYLVKPVGFDSFRELLARFALYWTTVSQVPRARSAS